MLHAPSNESKQRAGLAGTSFVPKPRNRRFAGLQNSFGNQAVLRMLRRSAQSPPSAAEPVLQRKCACGGSGGSAGECAACKQEKQGALQRSVAVPDRPNHVPSIVHDVLRSSGQPLDLATRAFFEPRFGHDLSQVRVHTGPKASESARSVNARAYTVGSDVVFAKDRNTFQTGEGLKLLAHELAHTLQQGTQAGGVLTGSLAVSPGDSPLEREADRIGEMALQNNERTGGGLVANGMTLGLEASATGASHSGGMLFRQMSDGDSQAADGSPDQTPAIYIPPCPGGMIPTPDPACVRAADQQRTTCITDASALDPGDYRDYRVNKCNQDYQNAVAACPTVCKYAGP